MSAIHNTGLADVILVEADGAARKPLKAPNTTEPIIPQETDLCIAVMGLDAAYKTLDDTTVHRHEIFARITGRPTGMTIQPEDMVRIAIAPNGLFKGCPPDADLAVFLNKTDLPDLDILPAKFANLLKSENITAARWFAGSAHQRSTHEITPCPCVTFDNLSPRLEFSHKF